MRALSAADNVAPAKAFAQVSAADGNPAVGGSAAAGPVAMSCQVRAHRRPPVCPEPGPLLRPLAV